MQCGVLSESAHVLDRLLNWPVVRLEHFAAVQEYWGIALMSQHVKNFTKLNGGKKIRIGLTLILRCMTI